MNGTMLMSERELCVDLVSCGMVSRLVIRELQIVREENRTATKGYQLSANRYQKASKKNESGELWSAWIAS